MNGTQGDVRHHAGIHLLGQVPDSQKRRHRQQQAEDPALQAEGKGAAGELSGDVGILSADQMHDLHRLAVDVQPGAGGKHHRADGGERNKGQHQGRQALDGLDQAHQALQPDPVIVDAGAGDPGRQLPRQHLGVQIGAGLQFNVDKPGQRQVPQPGGRAQPRFQEIQQPVVGEHLVTVDLGHLRQHRQHHLQALVVLGRVFHRHHLDGQGAADSLVPARRSGVQHQHPGHRQDRQKDHEGDQPGQETAERILIQEQVGSVSKHSEKLFQV